MDKKKLSRLLVSPTALTMVFGALASNAATLDPSLSAVVGTGPDENSNISDTNNNNNDNNNNNSLAMAAAMKPGSLRQLDVELRLS
jgi:hypothetical protein